MSLCHLSRQTYAHKRIVKHISLLLLLDIHDKIDKSRKIDKSEENRFRLLLFNKNRLLLNIYHLTRNRRRAKIYNEWTRFSSFLLA